MLQSVLVLNARPQGLAAVISEYRRAGVIEAALPFGLVRGEAVRPFDDPDQLIVASLWPDAEAYESWLACDERVRVTSGLWRLLDPDRPPRIEKLEVGDAVRLDEPLRLDSVTDGELERIMLVLP